YKKVHTKSISMGFGLTNENQKAEVSTVNEKIESMRPHYHVDAQADKKTTTSSTSEPQYISFRPKKIENKDL
ncbi:hypothetical protein VP01_15262g1, partial [Puccinia sorghi]